MILYRLNVHKYFYLMVLPLDMVEDEDFSRLEYYNNYLVRIITMGDYLAYYTPEDFRYWEEIDNTLFKQMMFVGLLNKLK